MSIKNSRNILDAVITSNDIKSYSFDIDSVGEELLTLEFNSGKKLVICAVAGELFINPI